MCEPLEQRQLLTVGTIAYGQVKSGTVAVAQTDSYTFSGASGNIITLAAANTGGDFDLPVIGLYRGGTLIGLVDRGFSSTITLPATDSYTISIHDDDFSQAVAYKVGLWGTNPVQPAATAIAFGSVKSGTVAPAAIQSYAFSGTTGDVVTITAASTGGDFDVPTIELFRGATSLGQVPRGGAAKFLLPATGRYTIGIHDNNFTETAPYTIGLWGTKPVKPTAGSIAFGEVKSGTVPQAAIQSFTFSGTSGDVISIAAANTGGDFNLPTIELYRGATILGTVDRGFETIFNLTATDTYTINIHDDSYTEAVPYSVGLFGLNPSKPGALTVLPATQTTGTVGPASEALYSFSADAGDIVSIAAANTGGDFDVPILELFRNGALLGNVSRGSQGQFTLAAKGTYIVRIHDDHFNETAPFAFALNWVAPLDGSISGKKFNDLNGDGTKNSTEPGLAGVTVYLDANNNSKLDTGETTALTDRNGVYCFYSLPAKTYVVREVVPTGWTQTKPSAGSYSVALATGQNSTAKDFGNKQNVGPTVSIVATDSTATEPATSTAAASDTGKFTITRTGTTTAALVVPFTISGAATNGTDYTTIASSATIPANAASVTITVTPKYDTLAEAAETVILTINTNSAYTIDSAKKTATVTIVNAGGGISGTVYHDFTGNATLDSTDPKLSGWKVFIDKNANNKLDSGETSVTTSSTGTYSFTSLAAGTYRVCEVVNSGWLLLTPTSIARTITLTAGQTSTGNNFGNARPVSISGTIFNDSNASGFQDSGEAGLSAWTVYIDANNNGKLDTGETNVATNSSGAYSLTGLKPGTFTVRVVLKSGYGYTTPSSYSVGLTSGSSTSGRGFGVKATA